MDAKAENAVLRDKIEELEEVVSAATEVNKHMARQIESLSLENSTLKQHLRRLRERLKPELSKELTETVSAASGDHQDDKNASDENETPSVLERTYSTQNWKELEAHAQGRGWLINPAQVELGHVIGEGAFGATHRGVWRGADCAVKVVRVSDGNAEAFAREATALSSIRHPNVVALLGAVIQPPERCWLVTELLQGGALSEWIHGPRGLRRPPLRPLALRLQMSLDVACGMEALEQHDPPILHRDLKPSNILLDAAGRAKVADMGLARVLTPDALINLTPETGSYLYMAPEVIRHECYATQADVWSWACLTCELLTGEKPYTERYLTPVQVALKVADDSMHPKIPEPPMCPEALAELLRAAFDSDPLNRPSFAVVAAVMRQIIKEEKAREATEVVGGGVAGAWQRWMKPRDGS